MATSEPYRFPEPRDLVRGIDRHGLFLILGGHRYRPCFGDESRACVTTEDGLRWAIPGDPVRVVDRDLWPAPPAPPIARACRLVECVAGQRMRALGAFAFEVLPGRVAEIHLRRAGRDDDGGDHPTERIAFGPADARQLLRDLALVVAELDEAEPRPTGPPETDRCPTRP